MAGRQRERVDDLIADTDLDLLLLVEHAARVIEIEVEHRVLLRVLERERRLFLRPLPLDRRVALGHF